MRAGPPQLYCILHRTQPLVQRNVRRACAARTHSLHRPFEGNAAQIQLYLFFDGCRASARGGLIFVKGRAHG
jgi:hypothetical protein